MTLGIGTDVVEIARVTRLVTDHRLELPRIFTARERAHCEDGGARLRDRRYAAMFAGKEAVMKALGTGWQSGMEWCDIDIRSRDDRGGIVLSGGALRIAADRGISRVLVAVSATRVAGVATAVAEGERDD
jgi:holo-[acyl-carrier protein] synthase